MAWYSRTLLHREFEHGSEQPSGKFLLYAIGAMLAIMGLIFAL